MSQPHIPFFRPSIDEGAVAAVSDALRSGWLTTGPQVWAFEQRFAEYVGAAHAVAVNSATAALHLSLAAIDIRPGDEVIVPTMTFAATAEVVIHLGATPVLVDIEPDTLCIDPTAVERAITPRTRAIMPVHYAGQPCDMDPIVALADTYDVRVIEDAAHALPAAYRNRQVGTIGDLTCFSFYANKTITTGEGGMVTTESEELAERVRMLSLHGLTKDSWKRYSRSPSWNYNILAPGYKYNMPDIAAALGLSQLARSEEFWHTRQRLAKLYDASTADVPFVEPLGLRDDVRHAWHLYVIRLQVEALRVDRNQVMAEMADAGIATSLHYKPLHMHPYYRDTAGYQPNDFPVAADLFDRIISLPIYPLLTEEQVSRVVDTLGQIGRTHRR